jgi:hypothetical protein
MHEAIAAAKEAMNTAERELERTKAALRDTLIAHSPWKVGDMIELPYGDGPVEKGTLVRVVSIDSQIGGTVWAHCVYPKKNGEWSTATLQSIQCEMIHGGHGSRWDTEGRYHPPHRDPHP